MRMLKDRPPAHDSGPPRRPNRLRRLMCGLAIAVLATGSLALASAPGASAASPGPPIQGHIRHGEAQARANRCTPVWQEGIYVGQDGYRVGASCSQLADFTEARAVSTFPYEKDTIATPWFSYWNASYWSMWHVQTPIYHPHDSVAMRYQADGTTGINLYVGSGYASPSQPLTVTATLPPDATGTVGLYTFRDGAVYTLETANIVDGKAMFALPAGTFTDGPQTVFASYFGSGQYPAVRTPDATIQFAKVTPDVRLTADPAQVYAGERATLRATLPADATGTVRFWGYDGFGFSIPLGEAPVVNGQAEVQAGESLAVGRRALLAQYLGDDVYASGNTSAPSWLEVIEPPAG